MLVSFWVLFLVLFGALCRLNLISPPPPLSNRPPWPGQPMGLFVESTSSERQLPPRKSHRRGGGGGRSVCVVVGVCLPALPALFSISFSRLPSFVSYYSAFICPLVPRRVLSVGIRSLFLLGRGRPTGRPSFGLGFRCPFPLFFPLWVACI